MIVLPEMVATFWSELVKMIGVSVLVEKKPVIEKGKLPTLFKGIDNSEVKKGVAL